MDLPQVGNEPRQMTDDLIHGKVFIRELFFLGKIIVQCRTQFRGASIEHGCPVRHPFLFCDIVITDAPGMGIDAGKQPPVDGDILVRPELKS